MDIPGNFTLIVDDFCPQVGPNHNDWRTLMSLMTKHPIKVTLFIPADNREVMDPRHGYPAGFSFAHIARNKVWCSWANSIASDRIELAMHGYTHWNYENDSSKEFEDISRERTSDIIDKMLKAFDSIPNATRGFRSPGHGINPYLYDVLKEKGFKYICLHKDKHSLKDTGMRIFESGTPNIFNTHFGCASDNCIHKIEESLDILLSSNKYIYKRLCDL